MHPSRLIPWAGGALAGLAALLVAAPGPSLSPDGMSYLAAGESFAHHGTFRVPWAEWGDADSTSALSDYPAGFPVALSVPIALGASDRSAARWVEAVSLAVTVGVTADLLLGIGGAPAALSAILFLIFMPAMIDIHLWALSEPLFLTVVALSLRAMVKAPDRPAWYGLGAGVANLVRYAGVFLVVAAGAWATLQPGDWRIRVRRGAVAIVPGVILHLWWLLSGVSPGGGVNPETYGGVAAAMKEGWTTAEVWLVPGAPEGVVVNLLAAAVAVLLVLMVSRAVRLAPAARRLFSAVGILTFLYVAVVGFARLHVVPDVPFDSRILGPLFFLIAVAAAAALALCWQDSSRGIRGATVLVLIGWGVAALGRDLSVVRQAHRGGLGYETAEWQESDVAVWLRGAGAERVLYSTDPAAVWFITHRPSHLLPSTSDPDTMRAFSAIFRARPSALVAFDTPFVPSVPPDSLAAALRLHREAGSSRGPVWIAP